MPVVPNGRVLFKEIPNGYPIPGKTTAYDETQTIDTDNVPLEGGFLVKILVISVDPYLRAKMRDPRIKMFTEAFIIGESLYNWAVGVVIRSEYEGVKVGDYINGTLPFQHYAIFKDMNELEILDNTEKLPLSLYVGVAGMPGRSSYYGWKEFSSAKKGDTIFVSGGAGPVGSMVIQFAKAEGLRIIASAGSDDKIKFIKSLGADVVFNYKITKTADILKKEGPIDIYWDNVGGETLEAALDNASMGARFIECGMISGYNESQYPIHNLFRIIACQLKLFGFLNTDPYLHEKYDDNFRQEIPKLLANGELQYTEHFTYGLENAPKALLDVQVGNNLGKSVIVVAEE